MPLGNNLHDNRLRQAPIDILKTHQSHYGHGLPATHQTPSNRYSSGCGSYLQGGNKKSKGQREQAVVRTIVKIGEDEIQLWHHDYKSESGAVPRIP